MIINNIHKLQTIVNKIQKEQRTNESLIYFFIQIRKIIEEYKYLTKHSNKTNKNKYYIYGNYIQDITTKELFKIIEYTNHKNINFLSDCCFHIIKDQGDNEYLENFIENINITNKTSIEGNIKLFYFKFIHTDLFPFLIKIGIKNIKSILNKKFLDIFLEETKNLSILINEGKIKLKNETDIIGFSYGYSWHDYRLGKNKEVFSLIQKNGDRIELI